MRGPACRKEGAPPSALIPPRRRTRGDPRFRPAAAAEEGGEEAAWPGGSGLQEHGRQEAIREGLSPRAARRAMSPRTLGDRHGIALAGGYEEPKGAG